MWKIGEKICFKNLSIFGKKPWYPRDPMIFWDFRFCHIVAPLYRKTRATAKVTSQNAHHGFYHIFPRSNHAWKREQIQEVWVLARIIAVYLKMGSRLTCLLTFYGHFYWQSIHVFIDSFIDICIHIFIGILLTVSFPFSSTFLLTFLSTFLLTFLSTFLLTCLLTFLSTFLLTFWLTRKREEEGVDPFLKSNDPTPQGGEKRKHTHTHTHTRVRAHTQHT